MTAPVERPARGRRFWLVLGSVAAVAGVMFGVAWTLGALANETRTLVFSYDDADVSTIDVATGSGEGVVVGDREPGTGIEVRTRLTDGLWDGRHSERLRGGRLELRADCPYFFSVRCDVRVEVHAPPSIDLVLRTDNGDVRVRRIDGSVDAASDNGDIRVRRLSGDLRVSTDNGDIVAGDLTSAHVRSDTDNGDVTLEFVASPRTVSASSDNGDLQIRLPRDGRVAFALRVETDNGSTAMPIRTDPGSDRRITAQSDNGDITIRYRG